MTSDGGQPADPRPGRGSTGVGRAHRRVALVLAASALAPLSMAAGAVPASALGDPAARHGHPLTTLATTASANARIASLLPARTSNSVLGSRFTMSVWDTAEDRTVFSRRQDASLRGASTTKILTSVAVLEALGPGHRLETSVLAGDAGGIVLRAGGDPLLTSADLRTLARDTAAALRAGTAPTRAATPSATNPGPTPASPAPASPTPGATTTPTAPVPSSGPPSVSATASTPLRAAALPAATSRVVVRVDDSLFPGNGYARGWISGWVPGQVRPVNAFARDDNRARDPASDAGRYFVTALGRHGIRATYGGHGQGTGEPIATLAGHTVAQAVSRALLISDNDTAEMLFRLVAVARGERADWDGARRAERAVLAALDIPLAGVEIVDGSGLSLSGRLTAPALTAALRRALSPSHPRLEGLRGWLPVAGRTGTLNRAAGRFTTAPTRCAAGRVRAKTGTLADAVALAGYAEGADGRTKVFVAIVNSRPSRYGRLTTKRYVDRVAATLTGCW